MTRTEMMAWQQLFAMYQTEPDRVEELVTGTTSDGPVQHWRPYSPCSMDIFDRPLGFYRIRPERKWRAWKPEEVPLGRVIRAKNDGSPRRMLLSEMDHDGRVVFPGTCPVTLGRLLADYVLENPDGGLVPCGVEVTDAQG